MPAPWGGRTEAIQKRDVDWDGVLSKFLVWGSLLAYLSCSACCCTSVAAGCVCVGGGGGGGAGVEESMSVKREHDTVE